MNTKISHPDLIHRRILRVHGSFLLLLTSVMTTVSLVGWALVKGPFALWHEKPLAMPGLFQAYLLMLIVGVVLWIGSFQERNLWKWDLIGLLAHLPPLAVNFIFAGVIASVNFQSRAVFSITVHTVCISLELFSLLYKGQGKQPIPAV